jgi:alpha-beta hydrolase superfamily lysophospholipase
MDITTSRLQLEGSVRPAPVSVTAPARRRHRPWRQAAYPAILSLSLVGIVLAVFVGFHAVIAWLLAYPPIVSLNSNPFAAKELPYRDVSFPSSDGRALVNGWWIPAPHSGSDRTVVLSHGYGTNREELWVPMYDVAGWLHGLGYNVLMFDYGFADPTRRRPATGGVQESRELLGALRFARGSGSEKLVVWGFSMGAGTALQAALQSDPREIDGMILDSTFVPTSESIRDNLSRYMTPSKTSTALVQLFLPMWSGVRLEQIPDEAIRTTAFPFPMLLIHGTGDAKASPELAEKVAQAQLHPDSALWIVEGADHEMMFRTHAEDYKLRVADFLLRVAAAPALNPVLADFGEAGAGPEVAAGPAEDIANIPADAGTNAAADFASVPADVFAHTAADVAAAESAQAMADISPDG